MTKRQLAALDGLRRAGQEMSNALYNWAQLEDIPEIAKRMREMADAWDKAVSELNAAGKPSPAKATRRAATRKGAR